MRTAVLLSLTLIFAACTATLDSATATAFGPLMRQQAIDAAMRIASSSRPEVGAPVGPLSVAKVEQTTLGEALQRLPGKPSPSAGYGPNMPVWYVAIDGLWPAAAPALGATTTQVPYRQLVAILDARTGMEIETWMTP
jgi:hypothetical protein